VKEQSHKDEMSRALRGDFERLRERGVSTTLAQLDESQPDLEDTVNDPTVDIDDPTVDIDDPAVDIDGSSPRPGWFGRLRGL
jgi:hypothetical protein